MTRVAIVGAGLAGLTLARALDGRAAVRVFDKSRGVGGRLATRRSGAYQFDHGAQFFTARSDAFRALLAPHIEDGTVARWDADFVEFEGPHVGHRRSWTDGPPHYVGAPAMNALPKAIAAGLDVVLETRVGAVAQDSGQWRLHDTDGNDLGAFDWLVLALPAPQAHELLPDSENFAPDPPMTACFSLLLGFDAPLAIDWQAAFVSRADISWISLDSSKPGRPGETSVVVHSTNRWADAHLDAGRERIVAHLALELERVGGIDAARAAHVDLHRWRYANVGMQAGGESFIDVGRRVAAIGDWFIRGRVEAAFTSAHDLARTLELQL